MTNQKRYNVAVVGATGAVGEQIIALLEQRQFPIQSLKLLSSARSAGKKIVFDGQEITVEEAKPESFEGVDIALFSAGGDVSKELAPAAVERGAVCIDNTNAFRMDPNTPLVVPEVNIEKVKEHQGIIANPNCSTIQMVAALKPLYDRYGISRIIVSTYQAVSGAGSKAISELLRQSTEVLAGNEVEPDILPVGSLPVKHQIAFNAIPQIDKFQDNGFTLEEMKMIRETKKIMNDDSLQVTATCVRIPVVYGHSESVYVELKDDFQMEDVRELLANAPGLTLVDEPSEQKYPLATESAGKPDVFVGRLRRDLSQPRALNMWVVSDNLMKGAAWNAVQIAEYIASERQ
ncbi:aspartate-semialdehyde dehydrogenase [Paenibacillus sp. MER 180]|uniref:Aspartate-semialdehyde dehydrogenase n=3 Tax=Paenibacillus TaxID=44249 RepID=A0AAJ2N4I9_9BACL|nr:MULTISPECIES: aspartate-semialdehyde dehydrogenase [Paenibacillus]EPY10008.1 strongly aspartate-semialdehyde dehydrogenase asd [Paenibacillus alvei A6-6i-x]MCM3291663.1 aspartate-semialdehyde dehydrogenase [Paenibacillus sp. MER 180]MCY9531241.1 aspartate-semialdehyde dehydrogenase [Paenibacillus alvei]MDT8976695.1 aspartate-semialdehyde dehydrogenase [Paenibacillus sp. chi10]OBY78467.1 aspartate-semialdehyde dehydrogenase [Paenibacillus sp. KS1]